MPNHVANKVFFECSDEKAKEIKTAVMYDPNPDDEEYTGFGTFDFNKLIPMPPALMIECGSETENGISLYLTAINPDTPDYDLPKMPRDQFYELLGRLNSERMYTRYNGNLSAEEIEKYTKYSSFGKLADLGKQAVDNLINYSATTWYDWCINNWGTKWNSYDPWKGEDHGLMFSTAWSAPHPVIEELSAHFPGVYFTHEWADEDIGSNCGRSFCVFRDTRNDLFLFPCIYASWITDWIREGRITSLKDFRQVLHDTINNGVTESYYCPLTADCYSKDCYGYLRDESVELYGEDLTKYASKIREHLMAEQSECDMAVYFDENNGAVSKLKSAVWDVENVGGTLYGKITAKLTEPFTDEERESFLDWVSGQNSDGLGEGFEQRPIEIRNGELYVHLWQPGDDYFLCPKDQIPTDQSGGPELTI